MQIVSSIFEKLIKKASAATPFSIEDIGATMCYLGTADLRATTENIFQWVMYLLSPILALILAISNARILLKRKTFSFYYAFYKSFLRVIILILIATVVFFVIYYFIASDAYDAADAEQIFNDFLVALGISSLIICLMTGIVYLFYSHRNPVFLRLAFTYIFVIPSFIIFLLVLVLNFVPAFNKYLPSDAIVFKRKNLKNKLIDQGKIPSDTEKK